MKRRLLAIAALVLLSGGCAMVGPVTLKHPETGQTVRCEGYWSFNVDIRKAQAEETRQRHCIEDYEQLGYLRH